MILVSPELNQTILIERRFPVEFNNLALEN